MKSVNSQLVNSTHTSHHRKSACIILKWLILHNESNQPDCLLQTSLSSHPSAHIRRVITNCGILKQVLIVCDCRYHCREEYMLYKGQVDLLLQ